METLTEQIEYGGYCVHGTNTGTPGGADLMCGACEAGQTVKTFCTSCGTDLWLTHTDVLVGCEPNPARAEFASEVREIRNQRENIAKHIHDIRRDIGERY